MVFKSKSGYQMRCPMQLRLKSLMRYRFQSLKQYTNSLHVAATSDGMSKKFFKLLCYQGLQWRRYILPRPPALQDAMLTGSRSLSRRHQENQLQVCSQGCGHPRKAVVCLSGAIFSTAVTTCTFAAEGRFFVNVQNISNITSYQN